MAGLVRQRVGGRDVVELMLDRTAGASGTVWDYATAYRVARAFEAVDGTWLEECFARDDIESPARLAAAVDLLITGGEVDRGLTRFVQYLTAQAFDLVQPHPVHCGGLLTLRKISALAEGFGIPCIPHGRHGLALAAWLQAAGAMPNCPRAEIVQTTPPLLPWEQWAPLEQLLELAFVLNQVTRRCNLHVGQAGEGGVVDVVGEIASTNEGDPYFVGHGLGSFRDADLTPSPFPAGKGSAGGEI